jgi:hypothetical protein
MSTAHSDQFQALQINAALANALDALKVSGAKNIPPAYDILLSGNGTYWSGTKSDGSHWKLIKHQNDSYNVEC